MLFALRCSLFVLGASMVAGRFGTSTPSVAKTKNPLDDAPPAEAAGPQSAPEDIATKKNKFDDEQAKIVPLVRRPMRIPAFRWSTTPISRTARAP